MIWCIHEPDFYGGVWEVDGAWWGSRSGDGAVPQGGPFATFDDARAWVLSYYRAMLEATVRNGMDRAASAQQRLLEITES